MTIRVSQTTAKLRVNFSSVVLALPFFLAPTISAAQVPPAKHFRILHSFTGGADGGVPQAANLFVNTAGSLFGTTAAGGDLNCSYPYAPAPGCGVAFVVNKRGKEKVLHTFEGGSDGEGSEAGLVQDADGNLYGTTVRGGSGSPCSCGVVFRLDKTGKETILYNFTGGTDGAFPEAGLILDAAGNLYGTTDIGGDLSESCGDYNGCGVVFKLDGKGKETVLYAFTGGADGNGPDYGSLVQDPAGNLYGTTGGGGDPSCPYNSGSGCGVVFKVDTAGNETVLHAFEGGTTDGASPYAGVVRDAVGNLFGTTLLGGVSCPTLSSYGCGVVFKLKPTDKEKVLYSFTGGADGGLPYYGQLIQGTDGSLYGTTYNGGDPSCDSADGGCGVVFKLNMKGNGKALYAFTGYSSYIGAASGVVQDSAGHLYGTTFQGGNLSDCGGNGCGMVYEVTP